MQTKPKSLVRWALHIDLTGTGRSALPWIPARNSSFESEYASTETHSLANVSVCVCAFRLIFAKLFSQPTYDLHRPPSKTAAPSVPGDWKCSRHETRNIMLDNISVVSELLGCAEGTVKEKGIMFFCGGSKR